MGVILHAITHATTIVLDPVKTHVIQHVRADATRHAKEIVCCVALERVEEIVADHAL
jgi:hypothetical protein